MSESLSDHARLRALSVRDQWQDRIETAERSDLNALCLLLIQKREVDGLNGRVWDASAHLYFEESALSLMDKINPGHEQ